MFKRSMYLALLITMLIGCANKPTQSQCPDASVQPCWRLEAKIGYRSPDKNGSGFVRWQQAGENSDVYISGPMGAGASTISITSEGATLTRSGEPPISAPNAEILLYRLLNFYVPSDDLQAWLQGQPGRGSLEHLKRNDLGQIIGFNQAGWALTFSRFSNDQIHAKPNKIMASKPPYRLTVIVKSRQ